MRRKKKVRKGRENEESREIKYNFQAVLVLHFQVSGYLNVGSVSVVIYFYSAIAAMWVQMEVDLIRFGSLIESSEYNRKKGKEVEGMWTKK